MYRLDPGAPSDRSDTSLSVLAYLPYASGLCSVPHYPLVGSFLNPVRPQDWEESTITLLFSIRLTVISIHIIYVLYLPMNYLNMLCLFVTSQLYDFHIAYLHLEGSYLTASSPLFNGWGKWFSPRPPWVPMSGGMKAASLQVWRAHLSHRPAIMISPSLLVECATGILRGGDALVIRIE